MSNNHRNAADVERAVKVEALKRLAREIGLNDALAAIGAEVMGGKDKTAALRNIVSDISEALRMRVLDDIARLENEGRPRSTIIGIVVKKYAPDIHNPLELETLKDRYRQWWRDAEAGKQGLPRA